MELPKILNASSVLEQLDRASLFRGGSEQQNRVEDRFRFLIASVYFARAAAENLFEQLSLSDKNTWTTQLENGVRHFNLVRRIRNHDYHRICLVTPRKDRMTMSCSGPVTMSTGDYPGACVSLFPDESGKMVAQGSPGFKVTPIGRYDKDGEPMLQIQSSGESTVVYIESSDTWMDLRALLDEYITSFRVVMNPYRNEVSLYNGE